MFGPNHYVPILKTKDSEFRAIKELYPKAKSMMTPLFELTPPSPKTEFVDHIDNISARILDSLGADRALFVDLRWIDNPQSINGQHVLEYTFDVFRSKGVPAIPVTGLGRKFDYQNAVKNVHAVDQRGICVRIEPGDMTNVTDLVSFINLLGATPSESNLIIDFREIKIGTQSLLTLSATNLLASLPNISNWKTLTLSGSAFPQHMGNVQRNAISSVQRTEWMLWYNLYVQRHQLPRFMSFGDYGIDHPQLATGFDPTRMIPSANIRYTATNEWFIFKGRGLKKGGSGQYFTLAAQVTNHSSYRGISFSWGDELIDRYAKGQFAKGGTPATWRMIGYNHHITFVTDQISNLTWP